MNPEVQKKALGDVKPITHRPADDLPPSLDKFNEECKQYKRQDEDVLSYALFPKVATEFFEYRESQENGVDNTIADKADKVYPV